MIQNQTTLVSNWTQSQALEVHILVSDDFDQDGDSS